jgi:hypothetical protein
MHLRTCCVMIATLFFFGSSLIAAPVRYVFSGPALTAEGGFDGLLGSPMTFEFTYHPMAPRSHPPLDPLSPDIWWLYDVPQSGAIRASFGGAEFFSSSPLLRQYYLFDNELDFDHNLPSGIYDMLEVGTAYTSNDAANPYLPVTPWELALYVTFFDSDANTTEHSLPQEIPLGSSEYITGIISLINGQNTGSYAYAHLALVSMKAVPEPAAIWGVLGGLAVLAAVRVRSQSKAKRAAREIW